MKLVINVPDEQADAISKWEDGEEYGITIRQTGSEKFDLVATSGEDSEKEDENETETEDEGPESMKEAADSFNKMKDED